MKPGRSVFWMGELMINGLELAVQKMACSMLSVPWFCASAQCWVLSAQCSVRNTSCPVASAQCKHCHVSQKKHCTRIHPLGIAEQSIIKRRTLQRSFRQALSAPQWGLGLVWRVRTSSSSSVGWWWWWRRKIAFDIRQLVTRQLKKAKTSRSSFLGWLLKTVEILKMPMSYIWEHATMVTIHTKTGGEHHVVDFWWRLTYSRILGVGC